MKPEAEALVLTQARRGEALETQLRYIEAQVSRLLSGQTDTVALGDLACNWRVRSLSHFPFLKLRGISHSAER